LSYKAPFVTCELAEAIARHNVHPTVRTKDSPPANYRGICWFCDTENCLPVRVGDRAWYDDRVTLREVKRNGKRKQLLFGVCYIHAAREGIGLVPLPDKDE